MIRTPRAEHVPRRGLLDAPAFARMTIWLRTPNAAAQFLAPQSAVGFAPRIGDCQELFRDVFVADRPRIAPFCRCKKFEVGTCLTRIGSASVTMSSRCRRLRFLISQLRRR